MNTLHDLGRYVCGAYAKVSSSLFSLRCGRSAQRRRNWQRILLRQHATWETRTETLSSRSFTLGILLTWQSNSFIAKQTKKKMKLESFFTSMENKRCSGAFNGGELRIVRYNLFVSFWVVVMTWMHLFLVAVQRKKEFCTTPQQHGTEIFTTAISVTLP